MRTTKMNSGRVWALLHLLTGALLWIGSGCGTATAPCGAFTFTGSPISNGGINNTVSFSFNPATCSATACTCNTICYIQIMRAIDLDTGNQLQPNSDQVNRMVTGRPEPYFNGWAVDRLANRVWGHYGRNNDGTFSGTLTTGSNTTPAVLLDQPSGWSPGTWFDAVSVPVCIDNASGCVDRLLGFEYWMFIVKSDGSGSAPFNEIGRVWHADAFDLAVAEWNADAAGLGKNPFPALSRLP